MKRKHLADQTFDLMKRRVALAAAGIRAAPVSSPTGLSAADWPAIIAFASAHFVLAALGPVLQSDAERFDVPGEVRDFLIGITQANAARNRLLLGCLSEAGTRFGGIGVVPALLKGAAFLAEDQAQAADWRFMQDLDLLVPADMLAASVAVFTGMGFRASGADYNAAIEAHYPPLISPCGTFSIELHTRLFGRGDFGLDARTVLGEARSIEVGGGRFLLPSARHRLGHILVHAQIHNRFFAIERLVLKDLMDLSMLASRHGNAVQSQVVDGLFLADPYVHRATRALFDTWSRWKLAPEPIAASAGTWGGQAMARLFWSRGWGLAQMPADVLRLELHRMQSEPGHLARRMVMLANPSRFAGTALAWSAKQRQRLWG